MGAHPTSDRSAVYRVRALGTGAELVVTDPDALEAAASLLRSELDRIDRVASRFRADSEVAHLDVAAGQATAVSTDLLELLIVAVGMAQATDGAVDPTVGAAMCRIGYDRDFPEIADGVVGQLPPKAPVPGWRSITIDPATRTVTMPVGTQIDLGATAKAWLADRVAGQVFSRFHCGVLVSLGGDVSVAGPAPFGGFRIGLSDIAGGMPTSGAVAINAGGLATSGTAVRQWRLGSHLVHHILDPSTGRPVEPTWRTVSVAAATCLDANAASTAAMVKGRDAVSWLASRSLPSRLVASDGMVTCVAGWPDDAAHHAGVQSA